MYWEASSTTTTELRHKGSQNLGLEFSHHTGSAYPKSLNTRARRALYDNLGKNEQLAIAVDEAIQRTKKDGWRSGNIIKEREVRYAIQQVLQDMQLTNAILELAKQQHEY